MTQIDKTRLNRFRKAYPELNAIEDEYVIKLLGLSEKTKKWVDASIKRKLKSLRQEIIF